MSISKKIEFRGAQPIIVNRHKGACLEREIYTDEQLEAINEMRTDPSGYLEKSTQLRILQESGQALDEYYRRMFPNVFTDDDKYEPVDANPLNTRFTDKVEQQEFVDESVALLKAKQRQMELEIQKAAENAGDQGSTQNTTPSPDGGTGGAGIGQISNN